MDNLERQQQALTRYLRDPDNQRPPAEMNAARVNVYRDLVFNNLSQLLSGTFPVLIRIIGDQHWRALHLRFVAHKNHSTSLNLNPRA